MSIRERITDNVVVLFLGAMTTGFIGGFAAHRALTESQGQTLILKTRLVEYEQKAKDIIAANAKIIELEKTVARNQEQNSLANELALANTQITDLEQKNATQLEQIEELKKTGGANGLGGLETVLQDDSSAAKSSLKVISHDQEFSMESGDIVGIGDASMIFTVGSIQRTAGIVTYSNTKKAIAGKTVRISQAVPIRLYEGCSVVPLKIVNNADGESVNFIADCSI